MPNETTYAGMIGSWQRLLEPLAANATSLAHLEGQRARLEAFLTDALAISTQQAALRAGKQEQSLQLRAIITEGERMANVLRSSIKSHYGIRSEKLAEFGIQPFRGRRSRKPTLPVDPPVDPGFPME